VHRFKLPFLPFATNDELKALQKDLQRTPKTAIKSAFVQGAVVVRVSIPGVSPWAGM